MLRTKQHTMLGLIMEEKVRIANLDCSLKHNYSCEFLDRGDCLPALRLQGFHNEISYDTKLCQDTRRIKDAPKPRLHFLLYCNLPIIDRDVSI